jgi:hypothetical protein
VIGSRLPVTRRVDLGGRPWGWLALLLAGAAVLRVGALDEAPRPNGGVVDDAWRMVNGAGWSAHGAFTYLLVPSQLQLDSPSYTAARWLLLVAALLGVVVAWWLGHAAYGVAAGFVAAVAVVVAPPFVAASREVVASVPLAALVALSLALLVTGRVPAAGAAAGVAAALDPSGWILLVPIAIVAWNDRRRLGIALALAAVLSIPAWFDIEGFSDRFGGGPPGWATLGWRSLGPAAIVGAVGLVGALAARSRADVVLASFVVAYGIYLVALPDHRALYLLPLVAPVGALAGRFRTLAPVALILLVIPLTWSIRDARQLRRHAASTMSVRETTGSPLGRSLRSRGAARLRLLERREAGRGGAGAEAVVRLPRRLAEAREPYRRAGLLPGVAP